MRRARKTSSEQAVRQERRGRARARAGAKASAARAVAARVAIVGLLLVACIVPVLFLASPISYIPLFASVTVIVLSFAYLRIVARSLEFSEASLAESCERGAEIDFEVHFKNKSILPVVRLEPTFYISDLFGEADVTIPASLVLMPREDRDLGFQASFDHLGTYSAGVSFIVVWDLLGLFWHTIGNERRHEVRVLPRLFEIEKLSLSNVSVQESRKAYQPIVTDDMDYAGVREYVPGDPIKTIHWKLSSRNPVGEYYTRLFETFGNPGINIIIDHSSPHYDSESLMQVFDALIESALAVGMHAREQGVDASFVYHDEHGETQRMQVLNVEQSGPLIDDMPRVVVGDGDDAVRLLEREGTSAHGEGNVAYCTAHVSDRLVTTLLEIKQLKRNPILFLVVPGTFDRKERTEFLRPLSRLRSSHVDYYVVSSAGQLAGQLAGEVA